MLEIKSIGSFANASMNPDLFVIRHKVYARSENMQGMSCGFDAIKGIYNVEYKACMPVDAGSIVKMRTLPFIVEVWARKNGTESFVGMIRVNLKSLPELISNVHAFASNLYPTMLIEGEIAVWDP